MSYPIFNDKKGGWYFSDETLSDWLGPFRSKRNAEIGLGIYAEELHGIEPAREYPDRDVIHWNSSTRGEK